MLDVFVPQGALADEAEDALAATLTDILLEAEGADPANQATRQIAWVFLHHPAKVYVAGKRSATPRYRVVASVPEGQWTDERRSEVVERVTAAIVEADPAADPMSIWVFPTEIPEGEWGGAGRIVRLADIAGLSFADAERGRAYADEVFSRRREAGGAHA